MEVKTTDLYLSAYLITHQITPKTIISQGQIKRKIIFIFPYTKEAQLLVDNFNKGQAIANIAEFRNQLEFVRDLMFAKLRE